MSAFTDISNKNEDFVSTHVRLSSTCRQSQGYLTVGNLLVVPYRLIILDLHLEKFKV
jgi:hypothetical protein